jgi:hypothetical protein
MRAITVLVAAVAVVLLTASTAAADLPSSGTFVYFNSTPGDPIGGGIEQTFTPDNASMSFAKGNVFQASIFPNTGGWYYVFLAPPPGQDLVPGVYDNAVRVGSQGPGQPGIDIFGNGVGCNTQAGSFTITKAIYGFSNSVVAFDATFTQQCEGTFPPLNGQIHVESPPDTTPPTLYLPGSMTVEAPDGAIRANVTYYASAVDNVDPNPTFSCSPASGSSFLVGTTTVNCSATDSSGNTATGSFTVTVLAPLDLRFSVSSSGTVDQKTGVATLSGTLRCSRAATVYVSGRLTQIIANRATLNADIFGPFTCSSQVTNWTLPATSPNGRFKAGKASVDLTASNCDYNCHFEQRAQNIKLVG